jgi:hypothetical protein
MEQFLPENYLNYSIDVQLLIKEYIEQLSDIQKKAYLIAKQHLGSSFHLTKSNGYISWLNEKNK